MKDIGWRNGWTEELAREACVDGFKNITALNVCNEYMGLEMDEYISPCMNDIKVNCTLFILYRNFSLHDKPVAKAGEIANGL